MVLVNSEGHVYLATPGGVQTAKGQIASGELLDLIAPFSTTEGARGPDLHHPRAQLRIVPGKLSGSPHIVGTRVETRAIAALFDDGYDASQVADLYPYLRRTDSAVARPGTAAGSEPIRTCPDASRHQRRRGLAPEARSRSPGATSGSILDLSRSCT